MRKKLSLLFSLTILFIVLTGCATSQKPMYYYGDYSNTLYNMHKNQTDESLLSHMQGLERIIEESEKMDLRVPPGIYAELGYLTLKRDAKADKAIEYFQLEKQTYPESTLLMDRLIQKAKRN